MAEKIAPCRRCLCKTCLWCWPKDVITKDPADAGKMACYHSGNHHGQERTVRSLACEWHERKMPYD